MSEQKINTELLEKVKALILDEPRRLRMEVSAETWEGAVDVCSDDEEMPPYREEERPPCGAVMCIGGHANYAALLMEEPNVRLSDDGEADRGILDELDSLLAAQKRLGLSDDEAERLFYFKSWSYSTHGWPEQFSQAYIAAKTPQERAQVTARRIDHFLKTNGAE